jgi:hypothetical protein
MTRAQWVSLFLLATELMSAADRETFDFHVSRIRVARNQPGDLHIDTEGLSFRSTDGKTVVHILMKDIREADVADSRALRFQLYDNRKWLPVERREFVFRAAPDSPLEQLARFLSAHVIRPVVGHYEATADYEIAAYHKRLLGGSPGTLRIGPGSIQFVSDKDSDSRTWLYKDIETIGQPGSDRFRITTQQETYVLELRERLPNGAYRAAWDAVYSNSGPNR